MGNQVTIAKSTFTTYLKLLYYTVFAFTYGMIGSLADLVMVNSSWTYGHIHFLWRFARRRIKIVYPPCDTETLQNLNIHNRENVVLSVGQFRPEKDHALQIRSFAKLLADHPEMKKVN